MIHFVDSHKHDLRCTQATERFEAIYPLLKEVALAGAPGSKAMKQVTQQIFTFALKLAGEGTINNLDSLSFLLPSAPLD